MVKLLEAKKQTGKTYTELAKELGLTNLYTAQLFQNQVPVCLANPSLTLLLCRVVQRLQQCHACTVRLHASVQTELKPGTVEALQKAVPGLTDDMIKVS